MKHGARFVLIFLSLLLIGNLLAIEYADDPYIIKTANRAEKGKGTSNKIIVLDPEKPRTKNITEKIIESGFRKYELPESREFPAEAAAFLPELPPEPISYRPSRTTPATARPAPPEPDVPGEAMDFRASDVLVSIPNSNPQRQPHCVTGDDGVIYAVWGEAISASANAIMFSKSTDGGDTWSEEIVVDNVGTNFSPRVAVYGTGSSARVHVVYNYVDWHVYDYYDTTGSFMYSDTVPEGDVYYCRSNTGGSTFGHYQAIANSDLDLIIMHFDYDEGGADINVDDNDNVCISFYGQADEGHVISLVAMIIIIILYEGLPPFWIDYTWYEVDMRTSTTHGGSFNSKYEIVNEWFMDNSLAAHDIEGNGSGATMHLVYTATGILSLGSATSYYVQIDNPFFSPSIDFDEFCADGYPVPAGVRVDTAGNPRVGITDLSGYGMDAYYSISTDGGHTWPIPTTLAASSADEWEPKLRLDDAQNTFLVWSDERHINTDVYCVWSEDGGYTLRPDQHKVNQAPGTYDQLWPGIGLFLSDTIRRLDVVWWDTRTDPDGDIYYNGAKWWRTNLNVLLNDTLANPMGGTVTLSYTSFGVLISREVSTGYHIIYHDPGTEICLDRISSGSDASERWVYDTLSDFCVTPPVPGNTYDVIYFDQYYTTFTTEIGNPPACTASVIPSVPYTYEYFGFTEVEFTDFTYWADVRGEYHYTEALPSDPSADMRWYCPEPNGLVLSPTVAPTYYFQFKATFQDPRRLNGPDCSHPVPHFNLVQRWMGGDNVGGITPLTDWADCGSVYEYENPKVVSETQRWHITILESGEVDGLGPYQPGAYHQWKPTIILIGPYLPENAAYCETLYLDGVRRAEASLAATYQPWADCGTPLWMGEFTTLGWVARDPRIFDPVINAFSATIRYGNVVTVVLENDFGYGYVVADSDTVTSGFPIGWAPTSSHNICAITPQVFDGTRFVYTGWSDGGDTCHEVVPVGDTTWTAYFDRQYLLEIISDHGTPWGGGWYNEGVTANFGVTTTADSSGGIRYIFDHWEGSGTGSYTGTDTSADVVMNNPIVETAIWNRQFYLDLDYTGCDPLAPHQSGDGWYEGGEMPTISTDSIIGDDGPGDTLRYVFDHWESTPDGASFGNPLHAHTQIFMDRPYTATAVYVTQWRFTVESTDSALGSPDPIIGEHWFNDGDTVHAEVTSPDGGMYCVGYHGYGSLTDGSFPWLDFVITQPSGVIWLWGEQFTFTVTSDPYEFVMGMASPDPPAGTYYYIPGTTDTFSVNEYSGEMAGYRYRCEGYTGTGPAAAGGDTNWVELVISASGELRWQFIQQARFVVVSPYDSPDPTEGVHWFDVGIDLHPNVDPVDDTMRCIGYDLVMGGTPTTGIAHEFDISPFSVPCSLHWNWHGIGDLESLLVISDHGSCVPPAGSWNWFLRGSSLNAFTSIYDLSDTADGIRHECIGWEGTGPVPATGDSNVCPITMTSSGTLTWQWRNQFLAHIECEHDDPEYSLDGVYWYPLDPIHNLWLPEGARIFLRVNHASDTIPDDSLVYCSGWRGTGTCIAGYDTTVLDFNFILSSPCSVIYNWTSYLVPLYVYSDWGDPTPSDTTYWIPGSVVDAFVTSPYPGAVDGVRYRCTGHTGTGDAPDGGGEAFSFTINDTSSITWHWEQENRLTIESWPSLYDHPSPPPGDHWYPAGDSVYGYVESPVWDGTDTMYCVGFHGIGSAPAFSPQIEFGFYLDDPSTVTWRWFPRDTVALFNVISPYDSPRPYGLTAWVLGTEVDANVDPWVISGHDRIDCIGWRGSGSVSPLVGDSNHVVFDIWEDSSLEWLWATVFNFEVRNPDGYGDPEPDVGVYTHSAGAWVTGEMLENPYWTGADTQYCVGFNGWGNLPSWDPHTDFGFHITMNSGLEWLWSDEAFRLTVNSAYGSPWPHGTTYWLPMSWVRNARVDSAVIVGPGVRAYCAGWTGTGTVPASGTSNLIYDFQMRTNGTITWEWDMQYSFYVENPGPEPDGYDSPVPPPGTYWYNDGDTVVAYITDNPAPAPYDTMYCVGYYGTGSCPGWSPQDSTMFVIHTPSTIVWNWLWEDTVARLDVYSDHDHPTPWGTTYWALYSDVIALVDATDEIDSVTRYNCEGFTVSGAVDSTDSNNVLDFIIDENTELTWNWVGQFYLTLLYEGLSIDPVMIGEDWYNEGDTAHFETETPVFDSGAWWGFVNWSIEPDTAVFGDTLIFWDWIVMDQPAQATAHYGPGVSVTVQKDPYENDEGWISVDSIYHDSTSIYTTWWGRGSYHDLLVPEMDSTLIGERYTFSRWSDGGAIGHRVGPINSDTTFTAYYGGQYMCVVAKEPEHEWGFIYADGDTFYGESARIFWWSPGPPHEIGVSTPDSCGTEAGDSMRFFFENWSDGGDTFHVTDSISAPSVFVAHYDQRIKLHLEKVPSHTCGYFLANADTVYDVTKYDFWVQDSSLVIIGASEFDILELPGDTPPDTVWTFQNWDDGGAIVHEVGPITGPEYYTANYNVDTVILAYSLSVDEWFVDSVHVLETRVMEAGDMIRLTNDGNIPLDFGMQMVDPGLWTPGFVSGFDRFVLRIQFNDDMVPPTSFSFSRDYIKEELTWATNGTYGNFGVGGENVLPPPYATPDRTENIWMQWVSPTGSTGDAYLPNINELRVWIVAKYHMP